MQDARILAGIDKNFFQPVMKLGEGSVQDIAKESGIKRPTAYVVLDELRKKECILKIPLSRRTKYIAKPPRELYDLCAQSLHQAAQALPTLQALHKKDERLNTLYFEGPGGIKESLYYRHAELAGTSLEGFWAKVDKWDPQTKKHVDKWGQEAAKARISIRAVAPKHPSLAEYREKDAELCRNVKTVPADEYSSNASIEATDLYVRITQYDTPQSVIIESPEVVKTVREIFEMVWSRHP